MHGERRVVDVRFVEVEKVGVLGRAMQPIGEAARLRLAHDADLFDEKRREGVAFVLRGADARHHRHVCHGFDRSFRQIE